MKKVVDYFQSENQMGDLLKSMGVSIRDDFSEVEIETLRKQLEDYMSGCCCSNELKVDLKKFYLKIKGEDEAGYLYQYLI